MAKVVRARSGKATIVPSLLKWYAQAARDLPWRRSNDPYGIWVSEIMLQQTQVKTVIPFWTRWMQTLPTIQTLAAAPSATVHKLWEGLGYYSRARNLHRAAEIIVSQHEGRFPRERNDILALPGIGRYTAGAIASIAYDQAAPILDGNVMRVLSRLFALRGRPRQKETNARLWELAQSMVSVAAEHGPGACSHCNQSLMELGALICLPRAPACLVCPVRSNCLALQKGLVEVLPELEPRAKISPRRFVAYVVERSGRYLVRQRPEGVINAHLWEFPNFEATPATDATPTTDNNGETLHDAKASIVTDPIRSCLTAVEPFWKIQHSITRYRITLEVFQAHIGGGGDSLEGSWLRPQEMASLAFASAHRKVLQKLLRSISHR